MRYRACYDEGMHAAPKRRAPLWQETLHQVLMLAAQEVIEKLTPGEESSVDAALSFLLPAVAAKYPGAQLCVCEGFVQHPDRVDVIWCSPCYKINDEFFNEMGWITRAKMEEWTRSFKLKDVQGDIQIRDREDVRIHIDKSWERRAKRIFNQHLANFESIALNVATRSVPARTARKRL